MPKDHIKGVIACCPRCFCEPEKIELWNCGPIVKLKCPICHYCVYDSEPVVGRFTVEGLARLWNERAETKI